MFFNPLQVVKPIFILAVLTLVGCATSNIRYDYDESVDFGQYKTYDFMPGAGPDDEGYQSLFTRYMIDAISLEMEKRGYVQAADPDLFVNFNANLQDKTRVTQTTSAPPPGYYGYRRGYYDPWMGYGYGTETHVSEYTEGTFNIDLIDARQKRLVWEAVGVGKVTDKALENLEQTVREGVPEFFALYPFVAGRSEPVAKKK